MNNSCDNFYCCEIENSKILSKKEERSSFRLINQKKYDIGVVKLDNCLKYDNLGLRCDYLLNCYDKDISIFIELKGKNINHAILQLNNSIKNLKEFCRKNIYAYSVGTKTLPRSRNNINKAKEIFRKQYNVKYENKNNLLEKDIEKL